MAGPIKNCFRWSCTQVWILPWLCIHKERLPDSNSNHESTIVFKSHRTRAPLLSLPSPAQVGNLLMSRYRNASLMKLDRHGTRLVVRHALSRQPSSTDLVYLGESPSFCSDNPGLDIVGTSGRECRVSQDHTPDSCDVLCCDRGYHTVTDHTTTSCNCRFVFCCRVRCDQCETVRRRHFCR